MKRIINKHQIITGYRRYFASVCKVDNPYTQKVSFITIYLSRFM